MNLKKSFEYQNFLTRLINSVEGYLIDTDNVTVKKQTHLKSKANPEVNDEEIEVDKPIKSDFTVDQFIEFAIALLKEKEELASAIDDAKTSAPLNLDSGVSLNKSKQRLMSILSSMAKLRPSERMSSARGYKLDINGAQVSYYYDVKEVRTIDYDRNKVKSLLKELTKQSDAVSDDIDAIMIQVAVNFDPQFEMTDSIEDAMYSYFN